MGYAEVEEIQADFKDMTFTEETNVKTEDVEGFISEADALINSFIRSRYAIPVGAGEGKTFLKLLCRSLVAARIKRIMEVKQDKSGEANQNILGVLLSPTEVMKLLKQIKDGDLILDGAAPLLSSGGFFSNNASCNVEPVIKKNDRQW